jgi:hypothetical protein
MAATSLDKSMRKAGEVHAGDAGNATACDAADNIDDLQVYSLRSSRAAFGALMLVSGR